MLTCSEVRTAIDATVRQRVIIVVSVEDPERNGDY